MYNYITEFECLKFDDNEIENFFNKFNHYSLEIFDLILYFSGFSGNNKEFVERLKKAKDIVFSYKTSDVPKVSIEQEISLLNNKELKLIIGLLNEAEFCAQSDDRYSTEALYLDYLKTSSEKELIKSTHDKRKILFI